MSYGHWMFLYISGPNNISKFLLVCPTLASKFWRIYIYPIATLDAAEIPAGSINLD